MSRVDHELDQKIPFVPDWIGIYHNFTPFWIRTIGFLLMEERERAMDAVRDFLDSMAALYAFAAEVYQQNFSTTRRPFYLRRPGFIMIHLTDPHLMCIPSLHVMAVIRTYTKFAAMLRALGEEETYAAQLAELKKGANDITESILYVKQHSVNCVSAGMYAMTRFDETLFPPDEAERFTVKLFVTSGRPDAADAGAIRTHIISLYRRFVEEGHSAARWEDPLLAFLHAQPQVG
ncbi:hypothetical protein FACS1894147_11940 [Spirochaetia bacterium]|nr:hypothetical protein FACS1894147_11940 [Spirochaetia bacterium]